MTALQIVDATLRINRDIWRMHRRDGDWYSAGRTLIGIDEQLDARLSLTGGNCGVEAICRG